MPSNEELLRTVYARFNARDIDPVLETLHPDVDWPNGMEGGRIQGRAGVRDYWKRQFSMIDPHVEPLRVENDEAGRTVVEVHQVVRDLGGNQLMDRTVEHLYTIRNGLIERMDIREAVEGVSGEGAPAP